MITRSKLGIVKPVDRLSLNTFSISPILKNPPAALKDPQWRNAMYDEYNALVKNGTWLLVLRPGNVNMVRSIWLFKHKFHADGTLSRYKARLVANGSSQQLGVDFGETFSPVVKPATIRMRSLYGLKQAPRARFQRFTGYATRAGFYHSRCDSSLFICRQGSKVAYLLIYVDDFFLTASSPALVQQIIASLHKEFDMTDLGALNYFLGNSADRSSTGLFLSYRKYALQLLERAYIVNCNPSRTPIDTESKLGSKDFSYVVQHVCLYMHDPREPHFAALKRILCYVRGILIVVMVANGGGCGGNDGGGCGWWWCWMVVVVTDGGGSEHAKVNNFKGDKDLPTSSSKDVLNTFNKYDLLSNEFDTFFEECKDDANATTGTSMDKSGKETGMTEVDAVTVEKDGTGTTYVGQNVDSDEEGEVEHVYDETTTFMAFTSSKNEGSKSGSRVVVENYFKSAWSRFGLVHTIMNSNGIFFFKFISNTGMETTLKNGPWFILNVPLILCKLSPLANVFEEDLKTSMCMETWCRSSFARAVIDFRADIELNDTLVVKVPKLEGNNKDVNLDMRIVTMIGRSGTSSLYECCKETFDDSAYDDKCEDLTPRQQTFCDVFHKRLPRCQVVVNKRATCKNRSAKTSLKASQNVSTKFQYRPKARTSTFETSTSKGGTEDAKVNNSKDDKNLPTSSSKDVLNTFNKYDLLSKEFDTFFEECKEDAG
nr:ribonuclease H-like domain-containing protein [Tanacetum cinerariifolium]